MKALVRIVSVFILFIYISQEVLATDYTWVGTSANWSTSSNWSPSGIPGAGDNVTFDASVNQDCIVDVTNPTIMEFTMSGYLGTLDLNGNTLTITGTAAMSTGTINDTPTTGQLTINTAGSATFNGTTFGAIVDVTAADIYLNGSTFNATSTFEKTGASNNTSNGNNTFDANATITNSGSGDLIMENTNSDTFNFNLDLFLTGSGRLNFANSSSGNLVKGNLTIMVTSTTEGDFTLANSSTASLTVQGNTHITNSSGGNGSLIRIAKDGDAVFEGDVTVIHQSTSGTGDTYFAEGLSSSLVVDGRFAVENQGLATYSDVFVGERGTMTFNGNIDASIIGSNACNILFGFDRSDLIHSYNGDITVETTNSLSQIRFHQSSLYGGNLGAGIEVLVGAGGFNGLLSLRKLNQPNGITTDQNILMSSGSLQINDCDWRGDVTFEAANLIIDSNIFRSTATLEKTGAGNDYTGVQGYNEFRGDVTITNSGTGDFSLSDNDSYGYNEFRGDATYIETNTGKILPARVSVDYYRGDIYVNSTTAITFGSGGSDGGVIFENGAAQTIYNSGAGPAPIFEKLEINKSAGDVTLNTPITVENSMIFTQGILNTDGTNKLTLKDGTTVSGVSNNSYVDGAVEKIGGDAFTFPIGDGGYYRPLLISATNTSTDVFQATYFNSPPTNQSSKEPGIEYVSQTEYWELLRNPGASNPTLTLGWEAETSGTIDDIIDLVIVRYDEVGSEWKNLGGNNPTGNTSSGTVDLVLAGDYGLFTLGSTSILSTLPIELIYFEAKATINQEVQLRWETATEVNNDFFTIERSVDNANWEVVAHLEGAGTSTEVLAYDYTDQAPRSGTFYYRLKQTDFDGQYEYSASAKATVLGASSVNVYPNPSQGIINVAFEGVSDDQLFISNMFGQDVTNLITKISGINSIKLDLEGLPSGVYFIKTRASLHRVIKK